MARCLLSLDLNPCSAALARDPDRWDAECARCAPWCFCLLCTFLFLLSCLYGDFIYWTEFFHISLLFAFAFIF